MIDTTQLTQLISAFRVETEKESISPKTVGSLFHDITDLLANASSNTEQQIFENWKGVHQELFVQSFITSNSPALLSHKNAKNSHK